MLLQKFAENNLIFQAKVFAWKSALLTWSVRPAEQFQATCFAGKWTVKQILPLKRQMLFRNKQLKNCTCLFIVLKHGRRKWDCMRQLRMGFAVWTSVWRNPSTWAARRLEPMEFGDFPNRQHLIRNVIPVWLIGEVDGEVAIHEPASKLGLVNS